MLQAGRPRGDQGLPSVTLRARALGTVQTTPSHLSRCDRPCATLPPCHDRPDRSLRGRRIQALPIGRPRKVVVEEGNR